MKNSNPIHNNDFHKLYDRTNSEPSTHSAFIHIQHNDNSSNESNNVWGKYDDEFATNSVSPLSEDLNTNKITPQEAATKFNDMLTKFLETKPNLVKEVKTFFKHNPKSLKDLTEAKKLKIELEKEARKPNATHEEKSLACQALRHYNFLLKEQTSKTETEDIKQQEKAYSRNFHKLESKLQMDVLVSFQFVQPFHVIRQTCFIKKNTPQKFQLTSQS